MRTGNSPASTRKHSPRSRRRSLSGAAAHSSWTSRLLPIPASPRTIVIDEWPSLASRAESASVLSSWTRATRGRGRRADMGAVSILGPGPVWIFVVAAARNRRCGTVWAVTTDHVSELVRARCAEAAALQRTNQTGRARASNLLVLSWLVIVTGVLVAVATGTAEVMIAVAPATLLITAAAFQQFADVTVTGAARRRLEALVNDDLGGHALVYETFVAGVRKRPPLVGSVRLLQVVSGAAELAAIVASTVIAFGEPDLWVAGTYSAITAAAGAAAVMSYRDMLRSSEVADRALSTVR